MISSAEIKKIHSLSQKKFRRQYGLFVAEGDKIVKELLVSDWQINKLLATQDWLDQAAPLIKNVHVQCLSEKDLKRISFLTSPHKVLALVHIPQRDISKIQVKNNITLVLDNIQDPGNMGTIMRTADWFGIENMVCSLNTVELYNPKVIQATMGSFIRLKTYYTHLPDFLGKIPKGLAVLGATLDGENLNHLKLPQEAILIAGNESQGISSELHPYISQRIYIPDYTPVAKPYKAESLNVAMATGILLYSLRKP